MISNSIKNKTLKIITTLFILTAFTLSVISCKEEMVKEEEEVAEEEIVIPSETKEETPPVKEEVVEKVDAPDIKGETFTFIFNQETRKYIDQETNKEVGAWIENAVKIEGKMTSAIALKPEAINKILEENRQKGIFKCPWLFDWQENKGMEIVELFWNPSYEQETFEKHGVYVPGYIGIKYSELINFYSPFDVNDEIPGAVNELIPKKKEDPDFISTKPEKTIIFSTEFGYKSEEMDGKRYGSIQFTFIDWNPLIGLTEPYELGNDGYGRDIIGEVKTGTLLGELFPSVPDFDFLDFANNPEFYENPGQFQSRLCVFDFLDDFSQPTSSLEKMLSYKNKAGQEIPVCVWPEEDTAYEQNN